MSVKVDDQVIEMEIDGGSDISLISRKDYAKLFPTQKITSTKLGVQYYGGEKCQAIEMMKNIRFKYGNIRATNNLYIMGDSGKPLIGRDWLDELGLWPLEIVQSVDKIRNDRKEVNVMRDMNDDLEEVRRRFFIKHEDLFTPGLGNFTKGTFEIVLKENTIPIFVKPRSVPFTFFFSNRKLELTDYPKKCS